MFPAKSTKKPAYGGGHTALVVRTITGSRGYTNGLDEA